LSKGEIIFQFCFEFVGHLASSQFSFYSLADSTERRTRERSDSECGSWIVLPSALDHVAESSDRATRLNEVKQLFHRYYNPGNVQNSWFSYFK
jgi:hypothetical protein